MDYPIGRLYWNAEAIMCQCGNCGYRFNTKGGYYRCPNCNWLPPLEELLDTLEPYERGHVVWKQTTDRE